MMVGAVSSRELITTTLCIPYIEFLRKAIGGGEKKRKRRGKEEAPERGRHDQQPSRKIISNFTYWRVLTKINERGKKKGKGKKGETKQHPSVTGQERGREKQRGEEEAANERSHQ